MSVQQSNISDLKYDLVLGVSQRSINGIMKQYYTKATDYFLQKKYFYVNGIIVDWYFTADGYDPFTVPSWNGQGEMPAAVKACVDGGFNCAFTFIPGDPGNPAVGNTAATYPAWDYNYLTYLPGFTFYGQTYNYTLCCQNLQVVYWDPFTNVWVNYTQPTAPNSPMSSIVKFGAYATLGSQSKAYSANDYKSPQDVRTQAAALQASGAAFTIQQLILNLDMMQTGNSTLPFMPTVGEFYYQRLGPAFIECYASALKTSFKDVPTLCYTLPQTKQTNQTIINPTNVQHFIEDYTENGQVVSKPTPDQVNLSTVNYFCAINGNTPIAPTQFNWNWLDSDADAANYDGAVAISKGAMAQLFNNILVNYVKSNCWVPQINCTNNGGTDAWSFSMTGNGPLEDVILTENSDNVFAIFLYNPAAATTYGVVNPGDYISITPEFQLEVSIKDATTITVSQWSQFTYTIKIGSGHAMPGTPLNINYSQDYSVIVQPNGSIDFAPGQLTTSGGPSNESIPYLTNAEGEAMVQNINNTVQTMQSADLTATPLGNLQQFILPGGNAFMFTNAQFTAKHDLACEITYLKTS